MKIFLAQYTGYEHESKVALIAANSLEIAKGLLLSSHLVEEYYFKLTSIYEYENLTYTGPKTEPHIFDYF